MRTVDACLALQQPLGSNPMLQGETLSDTQQPRKPIMSGPESVLTRDQELLSTRILLQQGTFLMTMSIDAYYGGMQSFDRLESGRISCFGKFKCFGLSLSKHRACRFYVILRYKNWSLLHAAVGVLDIATPNVVHFHRLTHDMRLVSSHYIVQR